MQPTRRISYIPINPLQLSATEKEDRMVPEIITARPSKLRYWLHFGDFSNGERIKKIAPKEGISRKDLCTAGSILCLQLDSFGIKIRLLLLAVLHLGEWLTYPHVSGC